MQRIFVARVFSPQVFKTRQGILWREKKYGATRLETACLRAHVSTSVGYKILENILIKGLDAAPLDKKLPVVILANDSLRGCKEYV